MLTSTVNVKIYREDVDIVTFTSNESIVHKRGLTRTGNLGYLYIFNPNITKTEEEYHCSQNGDGGQHACQKWGI